MNLVSELHGIEVMTVDTLEKMLCEIDSEYS